MKPIEEKPSRNEDEYFARRDAELIKEKRALLDKERALRERKAHLNKCPKCGAELHEITFHHMKVDECPECHGMWLDRGEIALIEHVDHSEVRGFMRRLLGLKA